MWEWTVKMHLLGCLNTSRCVWLSAAGRNVTPPPPPPPLLQGQHWFWGNGLWAGWLNKLLEFSARRFIQGHDQTKFAEKSAALTPRKCRKATESSRRPDGGPFCFTAGFFRLLQFWCCTPRRPEDSWSSLSLNNNNALFSLRVPLCTHTRMFRPSFFCNFRIQPTAILQRSRNPSLRDRWFLLWAEK